jgi:hypothetical protein
LDVAVEVTVFACFLFACFLFAFRFLPGAAAPCDKAEDDEDQDGVLMPDLAGDKELSGFPIASSCSKRDCRPMVP